MTGQEKLLRDIDMSAYRKALAKYLAERGLEIRKFMGKYHVLRSRG